MLEQLERLRQLTKLMWCRNLGYLLYCDADVARQRAIGIAWAFNKRDTVRLGVFSNCTLYPIIIYIKFTFISYIDNHGLAQVSQETL